MVLGCYGAPRLSHASASAAARVVLASLDRLQANRSAGRFGVQREPSLTSGSGCRLKCSVSVKLRDASIERRCHFSAKRQIVKPLTEGPRLAEESVFSTALGVASHVRVLTMMPPAVMDGFRTES